MSGVFQLLLIEYLTEQEGIVTEFFPQSDRYEYSHGIELEVYPSDKVDDPNYTCEIWVAVNEKTCL